MTQAALIARVRLTKLPLPFPYPPAAVVPPHGSTWCPEPCGASHVAPALLTPPMRDSATDAEGTSAVTA